METGTFDSKTPSDVCMYLLDNGIEGSICDVFEENEIDGEAFLELTIEDVRSLVPNKLGVVKKICRLIKKELVADLKVPEVTPSRSTGRGGMSPVSLLSPPAVRRSFSPGSISDGGSLTSSVSTAKPKFEIPDNWRPSIMSCILAEDDVEKRKGLTPQVRNEIVRDLVTTMFAYMPHPNKDFCKQVAKMLTDKYKFMKDVGSSTSGCGSWEKKLLECVNNKKKGAPKRKRDDDDGVSSPAKRGRPKLNPTLTRYPPLRQGEEDVLAEQALKKAVEESRPRKDAILPLLKKTFLSRRQFVLSSAQSVSEILQEHQVLKLPFALEQEIDSVLEKRNVVQVAVSEWKCKWAPAIQAYADTITGKAIGLAVKDIRKLYPDDDERDEKIALALLSKFLLKKKDDMVYTEYLMAENLDEVAKQGITAPRIAGFKDPDSSASYYVLVEQQVLCRVGSFTTALILWFVTHYVFHLQYFKETSELALFFQEFVLGLPSTGPTKKSTTYLTVTSDIQVYSSH